MIELQHGDCLDLMAGIPDGSVDAIICDLPYGTTACAWDVVIPFEPLWKQYKRIIKRNGAIVLFGSQPFSSLLVASNIQEFRYEFIWEKSRSTEFQMARLRPMRRHENICVFYKEQPAFNQELEPLKRPVKSWRINGKGGNLLRDVKTAVDRLQTETDFMDSILPVNNEHNVGAHPTQKPLVLIEFLIRTYTNEGDVVLDNCAGSFTTGVACLRTGRDFIGMEKDSHWFGVGSERVRREQEKIKSGLFYQAETKPKQIQDEVSFT